MHRLLARVTRDLPPAARQSWVADAALGVAIVIAVLWLAGHGLGPDGVDAFGIDVVAFMLAVVAAVGLAGRRRYPLGAFAVTAVATAAWFLAGYPGAAFAVAPMIAAYTITAIRGWVWGLAVTGLLLLTCVVTMAYAVPTGLFDNRIIYVATLAVGAYAVGATVWYHRGTQASTEQLISPTEPS